MAVLHNYELAISAGGSLHCLIATFLERRGLEFVERRLTEFVTDSVSKSRYRIVGDWDEFETVIERDEPISVAKLLSNVRWERHTSS